MTCYRTAVALILTLASSCRAFNGSTEKSAQPAGGGSDAGSEGGGANGSAGGAGARVGVGGAGVGEAGANVGEVGARGGEAGARGGEAGASAGEAGASAGEVGCPPEPLIAPECFLYGPSQADYPQISLPQANGVGIYASETYGGGFNVCASKLSTSMLAMSYTKSAGDSLWTPWWCFDSVPHPDRVALAALPGDFGEAFVTTRCGQVYRRQSVMFNGSSAWLGWTSFGLPAPTSSVTDIAVSYSANSAHYVYVADRGHVFVRHQLESGLAAPYGPWQEITGGASKLMSAGVRADHRQQVFSLDKVGRPRTAVQSATELDSPFLEWADFDATGYPAGLVDIEAVHAARLEVFALDASGFIWQREQQDIGEFSAWKNWDGPTPPAKLVALTGAGLTYASGAPLQLVGLSATGAVFTVRRTAGLWDAWHQLY